MSSGSWMDIDSGQSGNRWAIIGPRSPMRARFRDHTHFRDEAKTMQAAAMLLAQAALTSW